MSSLLNNASLLLNPAGSIISYQEDKIYSVLPKNGAGDFTFSGGDGGTRVNQQGYVVPTPVNLLNNTNTFSSWNLEGGTITGGFPDPDGGNTAYKYTSIGGNGLWSNNVVFGVASGTGGNYPLPGSITFSFWVKSVTGNNMTANIGDGVATSGGTVNITGEWQYITRSIVPNGPWGGFYLSGLSDPTNGYYIWHPQINIGTTALPYQPTTDRLNYPRITYQNGRGALLSEPQRTNVNTYSQAIIAANGYNVDGCSLTANSAISPDGTQNATLFVESANSNYHRYYKSGTGTASTKVWTIFAKYKPGGREWLTMDAGPLVYFNIANGTLGNTSSDIITKIEPYRDGWYRCTYIDPTSAVNLCFVGAATYNGDPGNYAGDGRDCFWVWGMQCEDGVSFPTSYIPTTTATVTRPRDTTENSSASSVIGQTEGVLYTDFNWDILKGATDFLVLTVSNGTTANNIFLDIFNDTIVFGVDNSGRVVQIQSGTITTGRHKIAGGYKNNDFALYLDGKQIGTDNSGTVPACSVIDVGLWADGSYPFAGNLNTIGLFNTRLTNTQLQELTTIRSGSGGNITYYGPYTIHTFTGSATFTPSFSGEVEVLVVAGGGGGGNNHAGGGGAGGLLYASSVGVSQGTGVTVTIGAGGASPVLNADPVTNGSNSVFGGLTAIGGGGGGNRNDSNNNSPGGNGGSGGGGGGSQSSFPGNWVPGNGIPGQGFNGGVGIDILGGGGGGASAAGTIGAYNSTGGNGGNGLPYSISGFSTYYAGGGGGGYNPLYGGGNGGLGGGGKGGILVTDKGTPGVPYRGAGGGGGGAGGTQGSIGGAGIVIVRYLT
jgi:hypothetical protein